MSRRGALIAIEGIDGSGKTSVSLYIVKNLIEHGLRAIYTHEPFSTPFSQALKEYYQKYDIDPEIEVLAIATDRIHHVKKIIKPFLEKGYIVVTDRYYYSSIAYQGALGIDKEWIKLVNRIVIKPDVAIYLRIPVEIALSRIKRSNRKWAFFEIKERLIKASLIYEELVKQGELVAVDATKPLSRVVEETWNIVKNYLCL